MQNFVPVKFHTLVIMEFFTSSYAILIIPDQFVSNKIFRF